MIRKRDLEKDPNVEKNPQEGRDYILTLHNDDIHDFNYVIESLIEVCNHDLVQAEQCTYLVHYKGECGVKLGKYEILKDMYDQLLEKELIVSLN